jgi:hypothetical protein
VLAPRERLGRDVGEEAAPVRPRVGEEAEAQPVDGPAVERDRVEPLGAAQRGLRGGAARWRLVVLVRQRAQPRAGGGERPVVQRQPVRMKSRRYGPLTTSASSDGARVLAGSSPRRLSYRTAITADGESSSKKR